MKHQQIIYLAIIFTIVIFTSTSCGGDDDCTQQTWYEDADGDGFGDPNSSEQSCTAPTNFVSDNNDFDDTNATAYPGAMEICNDGIDNDGNNEIDECLISGISGNWTTDLNDSYTINSTSITNTMNGDIFHILV